MAEAISIWIHIVAVTAWLGPQFFLFVAALPAVRTIGDPAARNSALRIVVYRFNWLAWSAMVVIVLTGIGNLFQVSNNFPSVFDGDFRYLWIFLTKMLLVGLAVLLTGIHTFVVGPAQLRLQEAMGPPEQTAALRRASILFSSLGLLASVAVIYAAALLAHHEFSFRPL